MIRRLGLDDLELLRDLRLAALTDAPSAFGSTYEREVGFGDDDWRARLRPEAATFVWDTGGRPLGMGTGARDDVRLEDGWLLGMWVDGSARGSGAADALVAAVVAWSVAEGLGVIRLHVTEGNARAQGLYRRHGFVATDERSRRPRDGELEVLMERRLP